MTSSTDDPTEAFEIIGDGTRIAILQALAERQVEAPTGPALSFSELRERVGAGDSGRFNYHLNRLRGRFVRKDDDGYHLTYPGEQVVATVLMGAYDPGERRGPVPVGTDCPFCGEPMMATYEDGVVTVTCEESHGVGNGVPPGVFDDRDLPTVAALMSLISQHEVELILEGTCPRCYGHAPPKIVPKEEYSSTGEAPDWIPSHLFTTTCERCGMRLLHFPGGAVLRHPAVVSLFYDHGIDVRNREIWELDFVTGDPTAVSEDPLRLRIDVAVEDDELSLTLDETASVVEVERR